MATEETKSPTDELLSAHQQELAEICRRYHVRSLKLFGSVARGDSHAGSDVDILVSFSRPVGLLHLVRLERELSQTLGVPVDLVTEQSISKYMRPQVLKMAKVIYDHP